MTTYSPLGLNDFMPFGKYGPNGKEGHSKVRVVLMNDFSYFKWLIESTDLEFTEEVINLYSEEEEKHCG